MMKCTYVIDEDGSITGTAGEILETFEGFTGMTLKSFKVQVTIMLM